MKITRISMLLLFPLSMLFSSITRADDDAKKFHTGVPKLIRVYCEFQPGQNIKASLQTKKLLQDDQADSVKVYAWWNQIDDDKRFVVTNRDWDELKQKCINMLKNDAADFRGLKATDAGYAEFRTYYYPLLSAKLINEDVKRKQDELAMAHISEQEISTLKKVIAGSGTAINALVNKILKTPELLKIARDFSENEQTGAIAVAVQSILGNLYAKPVVSTLASYIFPYVAELITGVPPGSLSTIAYYLAYQPLRLHFVNWATNNTGSLKKYLSGAADYISPKPSAKQIEDSIKKLADK